MIDIISESESLLKLLDSFYEFLQKYWVWKKKSTWLDYVQKYYVIHFFFSEENLWGQRSFYFSVIRLIKPLEHKFSIEKGICQVWLINIGNSRLQGDKLGSNLRKTSFWELTSLPSCLWRAVKEVYKLQQGGNSLTWSFISFSQGRGHLTLSIPISFRSHQMAFRYLLF